MSAAEERKRRWAAKKAGNVYETDNSKKVFELTSLADSLISLGHMEAYQLSSDKIQILLNEADGNNLPSTSEEPFDMFGDALFKEQQGLC